MDKLRKILAPSMRLIANGAREYTESMANLYKIKKIEIPQGKFKYVTVMVYNHGDTAHAREIVRGYGRMKYHLDVYDKVQKECAKYNLCTQCLGGGFMVHDLDKKYIKIFGKSETLGKADHENTRDILYSKYDNYKIDAEPGSMSE